MEFTVPYFKIIREGGQDDGNVLPGRGMDLLLSLWMAFSTDVEIGD
jgi:hypothetical protein